MSNRRKMLHGMATGVGALLGTSLFPDLAQGADAPVIKIAGAPKRVIFFLQNHGFDPNGVHVLNNNGVQGWKS